MAETKINWILIKKFGPEPIGAIGFIGNKAATIVAFYDDRDGNQDGNVSLGEWIASKLSPVSLEGRAVVEVAMQARVEPDVILRDGEFPQVAVNLFLNFARNLVVDGIYAAYFRRGVKMAGTGLAKTITDSAIKGFVIRKGFEKAVKEAFEAGMKG